MRLLAVLLALVAAIAGCRGSEEDGAEGGGPAAVPPPVSVGTLQALGPHRFEASLEVRREGGSARSRQRSMRLAWGDLNRWWFKEQDGRRIVAERIAEGGQAWARRGDGRYVPIPVADAVSDLQRTLVFRDRAFAPFRPRVAYESLGSQQVEGRPARGFRMVLGAPAAGEGASGAAGGNRELIALEGEVWVDAATGNRLREEWEGRYAVRTTSGGRLPGEVTVRYREERKAIGLIPEIPVPPPERIAEPPGPGADAPPRLPDLSRLPRNIPLAR